MSDRSVSTEGRLREVWDRETRKGRSVPKRLAQWAPESIHLRALFRSFATTKQLREAIKRARQVNSIIVRAFLQSKLDYESSARDAIVDNFLRDVARDLRAPGFNIELTSRQMAGKMIYAIAPPHIAGFFAEKLLQSDLIRAFSISPANRDLMVEQLISVLGDTQPKTVVRADVEKFFESIPHDRLLDLLRSSSIGSLAIKRVQYVLSQVSNEKTSQRAVGLPRGLGISSALAEIYMQSFDRKIKQFPETVYYARYVDDIVAVFSDETPGTEHRSFLASFEEILLGMTLRASREELKRYEERYRGEVRQLPAMNLLGYAISVDADGVQATLSLARRRRIEQRLLATFGAYSAAVSRTDNGQRLGRAAAILRRRVDFLTSSTRLQNSKSAAHVGIYASNRLLNSEKVLEDLDGILARQVSCVSNAELREQLCDYGFVSGFKSRRFSWWTASQLAEITSVWSRRHE